MWTVNDSDPCHFVIFGATGHLASTKLLPALYGLEAAHRYADNLRFVAFARREWNRDDWLTHMVRKLRDELEDGFDTQVCERLAMRFDYIAGDLHDSAAYERLAEGIRDSRTGACENIAFYLAIPPDEFSEVITRLDQAGFNRSHTRHRIVVEKPFGTDLQSAQ